MAKESVVVMEDLRRDGVTLIDDNHATRSHQIRRG